PHCHIRHVSPVLPLLPSQPVFGPLVRRDARHLLSQRHDLLRARAAGARAAEICAEPVLGRISVPRPERAPARRDRSQAVCRVRLGGADLSPCGLAPPRADRGFSWSTTSRPTWSRWSR